jgi:hypothetical protein
VGLIVVAILGIIWYSTGVDPLSAIATTLEATVR